MAQIKKETNWRERVMAFMNLGEQGKVDNFGELAKKLYKKAIKERELKITRLTDSYNDEQERNSEILDELKEDVTHASITVDAKKLDSLADRESYFKVFDSTFSTAFMKVDQQEEIIKAKKDNFSKEVEKLKGEIKIFKLKLSYMD